MLLSALVLASSLVFQPLDRPQTVPGVGAAQGAEWRDGKLYVFGDADTGVILELALDSATGRVTPTGRSVRLTVGGVDRISHPTGLTFDPADPGVAYLGDTVDGRGMLYVLDWAALWQGGTLDGAIVNAVVDDTAVRGSRPEAVRVGERWLLASSDYGDQRNEVRLYDLSALRTAQRTSDAGVLVARFPCGPWVQSLHWIDERGELVLVQNQIEGLRWRLTVLDLAGSLAAGTAVAPQTFDFAPTDELEGFHLLPGGRAVFVSSSTTDNVVTALVGAQ